MAQGLTPQEKDRAAAQTAQSGETTVERSPSTWLWSSVALIVLVTFAAGGIAGFLGGRIYERNHGTLNLPDTYWLLGALLVDRSNGVYLESVYPGGPAANAGLQDSDRLVSINGEPTNSAGEARGILSRYQVGDVVQITYERSHRFSTAIVILGEYGTVTVIPIVPPEPPILPTLPSQSSYEEGRLGVYYRMLKPGDPFAVSEGALIVRFLDVGTPAETAGLAPGDIITQVGGVSITQSNPLGEALNRYSAGDRVTLGVNRSGENLTVRVTLGGG